MTGFSVTMTTGLFKYFPTERDKLKWFANRQILLTPPKYFNDPWDFAVQFRKWSVTELRKQCPFSWSENSQLFNKFRDDMTSPDFHVEESRNYQEEVGKIVGVVSLTQNPLDRVMWAHYAESHRGFVAEFAHREEFLKDGFRQRVGPFGPAAKVKYSNPNKQQPKCKRDYSNLANVLWRKHSAWYYEHEWRVVQSHETGTPGQAGDGTPRSLLKFEPNDLIRVIFGLYICESSRFLVGGKRDKTSSGAACEPQARAPLRSNRFGNRMQVALFEQLTTCNGELNLPPRGLNAPHSAVCYPL